jgi:osmotically-inducible protein OsmY
MRTFTFKPNAAFMTSAALILMTTVPMAASEADNRIEASAKSSYNFMTYLRADTIKVSSNGGVVTLTGNVAQEFHRTLAEDTVSGLPGVKSVNNQLTITGDQPAEHSDGWITMKVMTALTFHKNVSASDTTVHTKDGIVTLTGKADNAAQKELTSEYAKDVEGVTEVRNQLVVNGRPTPRTVGEKVDDASITAQVKTTLLFHKSTHVLATKVETKDGVVTLHGEAKSAAERELVTKLAEDVKGVKQVHNRMNVQKG